MAGPQAELEWQAQDVPVSTRFQDPYYSLEDGWAETAHVFLAGNGLPDRFRDGFQIAELGFGTGLNFLVTLAAWRAQGQKGVLRYTSFEAFPLAAEDMARALARFPTAAAAPLLAVWRTEGGRMTPHPEVELEVIIGDARQTLPEWQGLADAWFLDGFAPARNPELWEQPLLHQVARHTAPGGTAATYTAAGAVRRGLQSAGFEVARVPGYGRKRHMTRAVLP